MPDAEELACIIHKSHMESFSAQEDFRRAASEHKCQAGSTARERHGHPRHCLAANSTGEDAHNKKQEGMICFYHAAWHPPT